MKIFKSITVLAVSFVFIFCSTVMPVMAGDNDNNLPQIMQELSLDKTQAMHENEMSEIRGEGLLGTLIVGGAVIHSFAWVAANANHERVKNLDFLAPWEIKAIYTELGLYNP